MNGILDREPSQLSVASLRVRTGIDQVDRQIVKVAQVARGQCGAPRQNDTGDEGVAHINRTAARLAFSGDVGGFGCRTGFKRHYAVFQIVLQQMDCPAIITSGQPFTFPARSKVCMTRAALSAARP